MSKTIACALLLSLLTVPAALSAPSAKLSPRGPDVDLRTWTAGIEGGEWAVSPDGRSAMGVGQVEPRLLFSSEPHIGFVLRGRVRVESLGRGGAVGLVLGQSRLESDGEAPATESLVLLEWAAIADPGDTSGARLLRVSGSAADPAALLAADSAADRKPLGLETGRGLTVGRAHDVEIEYRGRRARVAVDGRQILDASGVFAAGRLGLYVSGDAVAHFSDLRLQHGNALPVADGGDALDVTLGGDCAYTLPLDGSRSNDPDGDPLTYRWTGDFGTIEGPRPELSPSEGRHRPHADGGRRPRRPRLGRRVAARAH